MPGLSPGSAGLLGTLSVHWFREPALIATWHSPCVSAPDFPLCEDASYTRVGPHFKLIIPVRTLCPKKVTFWGTGG